MRSVGSERSVMPVKPSMSVNSAVISRISPRSRSAAGSAAMRRTTSGARCCSKLSAQQPGAPLVVHEADQRGEGEGDDRHDGWAGRIQQHAEAWDGGRGGGGPRETDDTASMRRGGGPQSRGHQKAEQAEQRGAGDFDEVRPDRSARHLPAQDRLDRLGLDPHRWRRRRGGRDAQAARLRGAAADQHDLSGERGPRARVRRSALPPRPSGAAEDPQRRNVASLPSGTARSPAISMPSGSISSAPASLGEPDRFDRQARPNHVARHHQQRHAADRAVRVGGHDQGAEALRRIGKHRDRADHAVGPPQARHRDGARGTGSALRAGPDRNSPSPGRTQERTGPPTGPAPAPHRRPPRTDPGRRTVCRARARRDDRRPRRIPVQPCGCAAMAMGRSGQVPRGRYRR